MIIYPDLPINKKKNKNKRSAGWNKKYWMSVISPYWRDHIPVSDKEVIISIKKMGKMLKKQAVVPPFTVHFSPNMKIPARIKKYIKALLAREYAKARMQKIIDSFILYGKPKQKGET